VAAVLAVLLLAGGGTWLALGQRDGSAGGTAAGTPTSADPSSSPAPTTSAAPPSSTQQSSAAPSSASSSSSSSEASSQPSSSAPPPAADPATAVRQTLDRYYALLPGDPEAAYAMTGPTLRSRASASYYRDFWKPWTEVSLVDVSDVADQGGGTYTATTQVRFTKADGSGHTELHSVRFVRGGDGGLLVDLDEFVRTL
jgi:cytoskeletal protein RodZ